MQVFLDTIGCRLNQAEIERMAAQLRKAGHNIVDNPHNADLVIVNTCAVTAEAASDSRQKIRQAVRAGARQIVATGCWATLDADGARLLDGVSGVVGNLDKELLVQKVLDAEPNGYGQVEIPREPLPGIHLRTRAFIKVQDGCDNFCTYCITRIARGRGRSQPVEDILKDIRAGTDGGSKEVVLTGVHLGSWGLDLTPRARLQDLATVILRETDVPRVRFSSLEPWDLDETFFSLWENPRLCRHLHLPLQSGSNMILKRMSRNTTAVKFTELVKNARAAAPLMAITTDLMVGFPGETERDFYETLSMVESAAFAGGHVFTFSARPGTAAERMPDQVPYPVRKQRSRLLREALNKTAAQYKKQFMGSSQKVLWESAQQMEGGKWRQHGLTDHYLRVATLSDKKRWNELDLVRITGMDNECMQGEIIEEPGKR